jgi:4-amino-4-deoxy-L-arabinose transferase-like glycosyltransferase
VTRPLRWLDDHPARVTRIVVAVCLAVIVARVVLALATPAPALTPDGQGYDDSARRIVRDGYYAWVYPGDVVERPRPNAMQLPGYAYFLAGIYRVPGAETPSQPLVSVAQALLSGLTLAGIYLIARRLGGTGAGAAAVALGALYVPFWWSYRHVLTEDLFAALCVWAVHALLYALGAEGGRARLAYAAAGVAAAAAMLVRATAAPWLVLAAIFLLAMAGADRRRYLRGATIVLVAAVLAISPWWIRNARIYGTFVPFNTLTATGSLSATFETIEERDRAFDALAGDHLMPDEELAYNRTVTDMARERTASAFSADPLGYLWGRLRQTLVSVLTYHPNPWGGFSSVAALLVEALHLGALGLAALGLWRHRRDARVWVLATLPLALFAVHFATLAYSRYFFPMMPFVIVLAGLSSSAPRRMPRLTSDGTSGTARPR